jgi:hypothetical protein
MLLIYVAFMMIITYRVKKLVIFPMTGEKFMPKFLAHV